MKKAPEKKKLAILVVEDQGSLRDVVSLYLRRSGYEIHTADTGKAALRLLAKEEIHLVLLDLMLPDLDGLEVLTQLRNIKKNGVPYVIVVSAMAAKENKKIVLERGGNEYISKPFQLAALVERIKAIEGFLI